MSLKDSFRLIKQTTVKEYSSELKLYSHPKSGATILFMENDDTNKVFGVSFRTPVSDSTGVPHILEHSVLNGSQNYPLKEPFVNLIKSSLNTFLNAFTYPDRTIYPVASQNKKDLYNLAKVYMDAVFFPKLLPETFKQEGWHYELVAKDKPLTYKGVVFNEMKGVYSNPDGVYTDHIMNTLNPDNTYQHDSGGNPEKIPTLTYKQFLDFHSSFYHPVNSLIFIYGDDISDDRFDLVSEYLDKFDKITVDSQVQSQPLLSLLQPKIEYFDPGDASLDLGYVSTSWLLEKKDNRLPYIILDKILSGSPTAPVYKALMESGLGQDITPFFGFELDLIQPMISYGLKGVQEANRPKVLELIEKILKNLVANGLDGKDIEAAISSTEFELREYETGNYPKGLSMMLDIVVDWVYDRDFMTALSFEKELYVLKKQLAFNPKYFEDIIQKELLENTHTLNLNYLPKKGLLQEIGKNEVIQLENYKQTLTDAQLDEIIVETQKLKDFQDLTDTPEQLATLPRLTFEDLKGKPEVIPSKADFILEVPVYHHDIATNKVAYIDVGFDLQAVDSKYYPYLPLYSRLFTELDTDFHTASQINQLLDIHTGNFSPTILNTETVKGETVNYLFLRGKVLPQNIHYLTSTWQEIIKTLKLDDKDKINQILTDLRSSLEASMVSDGRAYGIMAVNSGLSKSGKFSEITSGYRYLQWLKQTISNIDTEWPSLLDDLKYMQKNLFVKKAMIVNITAESSDLPIIQESLTKFIGSFEKGSLKKAEIVLDNYEDKSVFIIPTKVNYVCYGVNLKNLMSDKFSGQLDVILNKLNYDYLWSKIRAQGGAYGSRASYDKLTGIFNIWSYRDPRFEGTMADYAELGNYLQNIKLSDTDILNSVIGSIGKFDTYSTPRQKGWLSLTRTLIGRTYPELTRIRQQILDVNIDDFHAVGDALIKSFEDGKWAIFTSQGSFDEAVNKADFDIIKAL